MQLGAQVVWLFLLALPVACVSWTLTREEALREFREYCIMRSRHSRKLYQRKCFYALTCEYCVSHYIAAALLAITRYKLLFDSWKGYLVAGFALVWIANVYMGLFQRLRLDLKERRIEIAEIEQPPEQDATNRAA